MAQKQRPFPEQNSAELHSFNDNSSNLSRNTSISSSFNSDIDINAQSSSLFKTRDSIFLTKAQLNHHRQVYGQDDDYDRDNEVTIENVPDEQHSYHNQQTRTNDGHNSTLKRVSMFDDGDIVRRDKNINLMRNNTTNKSIQRKSVVWNLNTNEEHDQPEHKVSPWDSFEPFIIPDDDDTLDTSWSKFFLKIMKILTYGITFLLVVFCGVISKLLLHLMSNMTRIDKKLLACNSKLLTNRDKNLGSIMRWDSPERIAWIWSLFFVMIMPDLFTLLKSIRICVFKNYQRPDKFTVILMAVTGSAEVIGISLLVYVVLPSIDVITGLMFTNCVFLLPAFCLMFSGNRLTILGGKLIYMIAFAIQILALIMWPLLLTINSGMDSKEDLRQPLIVHDNTKIFWAVPLSGILISLGYWENFVTENISYRWLKSIAQIKKNPICSKYGVYLYVSIWKCCLYLISMILIQGILAMANQASFTDMIKILFTQFFDAFSNHKIDILNLESEKNNSITTIDSSPWAPLLVGLIQIVASFFCYQTIVFVCKICIQPFSFALPINLILPFSISLVSFFISVLNHDQCFFVNRYAFFGYSFWNSNYNVYTMNKASYYFFVLVWLLAFVSQAIVTSHIWTSSKERLASVDKLFIMPFYSSVILDQSIMLNRRIEDANGEGNQGHDEGYSAGKPSAADGGDSNARIKIYACATVWHETAAELVQMIRSIMRMDEDQCYRRMACQYLNVDERKADYYDFETHLFVDDAFIGDKDDPKYGYINEYVNILISVLDEAAGGVYKASTKINQPKLKTTPYGGRIEWLLPGGTNLIAHLKNKEEIRHRKRWSQVMYMYYLIGYKIYEQESNKEVRDQLANNTFILALDGDINFRPEAVLLLVDLMRKNLNLGAACGRIHPVGTGPMAWYQKFEYAISHWLQKATEHVFGCVLCSPGCFSLFRATAIVKTMHRYTTKPTEAIHYVQYDQGEDRWLCTLMLQQGWRVEYSAASDAFTHCPEGFDEFYIQRRRWAPSTMANIIDLIKSYKHTVKKNDNISSLYMLYQAGLMLGTILSPGTIFLMLVGSMNTAFNIQNELSFYINVVPVFFFILICFYSNNDIQILTAQILSTFYAMLMLAVFISTFIEIRDESIFAPSVIFFVGMLAIFVISALIHPQEFSCLFPAVIYLLTIPSMYLLLTIYSIINLNIVTWGTRENPAQKKQEEEQQKQEENKEKQGKLNDAHTAWWNIGKYFNKSSGWDVSCLCCSQRKNDEEIYYFQDIKDSLKQVTNDVVAIKTQIDTQVKLSQADLNYRRRNSVLKKIIKSVSINDIPETTALLEEDSEDDYIPDIDFPIQNEKESSSEEIKKNKENIRTIWVKDEVLKNAKRKYIDEDEELFWVQFIEKYLKPLFENKQHKEKIKTDLIDLRNKAVFAFGFINILFVLFVFLLQLHKDTFSIGILVGEKQNGTHFDEKKGENVEDFIPNEVKMDPIGLILIVFFGVILIIQCIGMFIHRFGTLSHLLAFTDLNFFKIKEEDVQDDNLLDQNAVEIVKYIMDKDPSSEDSEADVFLNMEVHFLEKYHKIAPDNIHVKRLKLRRKSTVKALLNRRDSVFYAEVIELHIHDVQETTEDDTIEAIRNRQRNKNNILQQQNLESSDEEDGETDQDDHSSNGEGDDGQVNLAPSIPGQETQHVAELDVLQQIQIQPVLRVEPTTRL